VRDPHRLETAALVALLLAGGALVWSVQLRAPLEVDPRPLDSLPSAIGGWRARAEIPLETEVERMLRADFNLQRVYGHAGSDPVGLYIGYYGTERGGRPEHTPEVCYPMAGFEILEQRVVSVDPARGLRANEMLVELDGQRQLVQFWYRSSHRTGLLGPVAQSWDRLVGRLQSGRSDGALVRFSTQARPGDELGARSRLADLGAAVDRLLDSHWPAEIQRGS